MHNAGISMNGKHLWWVSIPIISILILIMIPNSPATNSNINPSPAQSVSYIPCNAVYIQNPDITLNGAGNESCWQNPAVTQYNIPCQSIQGYGVFMSIVQVQFIYDASNLYVLATWNDSTIKGTEDMQDGISFCWNINCVNFSSTMFAQPNEMETQNASAMIDNWWWESQNLPNGSAYQLDDNAIQSTGWYGGSELENVNTAFNYVVLPNGSSYYRLEIERALQDSSSYHCQFDHNGTYQFAVAVFDNDKGEDHAISDTYELDFENITIGANSSTTGNQNNGWVLPTIIGSIAAAAGVSIVAVVFVRKRRLRSIPPETQPELDKDLR
jgi:hypothetical protein